MKNKIIIMVIIVLLYLTPFCLASDYGVETTLVNPDDNGDTRYGCSLAFNEDYIYVGAEYTPRDDQKQIGRVYVYDHSGNFVKALDSTDWENTDKFGSRILASDEYVLVTESEIGFNSVGQAYLFKSGGDLITKLDSPNPDFWGWFGTDTSFFKDQILVTEPSADTIHGIMTGRIQIYDMEGNHVETRYSPEPTINSGYGFQMETSENLIAVTEIVGVLSDQVYNKGFVHVYDDKWNYQFMLESPDPEIKNVFGWSLLVSDDHIYVGDPYAPAGDLGNAGIIYIYNHDGTLETSIESPTGTSGTYFGEHFTLNNGMLVVGTQKDDSESFDAGKVYIYTKDGQYLDEIVSPEASAKGFFGSAVIAVDDKIIIGAEGENTVYVYSQGTQTQSTEVAQQTESEVTSSDQSSNTSIPGYPLTGILCGLILSGFLLSLLSKFKL